VSEDSFKVRNLPAQSAYQCTDENNEIAFRFTPVHCTVDESDGSFTIHTDHKDQWNWHMQVKQYVVETGNIDNKGKYSFREKSTWTKNRRNADVHTEEFYDSAVYFENDIRHKIKQRKLFISV
jgi:hypothetical protein